MKLLLKNTFVFWLLSAFFFTLSMAAQGEEKAAAPAAPAADTASEGEQIDVDKIKEKYWARGDESELGVVQNRLYTKANKWSVGVFGGIISSDPFLSTKSYGGSVGYNFNDTFGLSVIGWKTAVSPSSALETFQQMNGATANTNETKSYFGTELATSILYGKLSLVGKSIIYYDLHLLVGAGATQTQSGTDFTANVGIGQRFYITQNTSLRFDYRLMRYRETIDEKEIPTKIGQPIGDRTNWTSAFTLGFEFMFGGK